MIIGIWRLSLCVIALALHLNDLTPMAFGALFGCVLVDGIFAIARGA